MGGDTDGKDGKQRGVYCRNRGGNPPPSSVILDASKVFVYIQILQDCDGYEWVFVTHVMPYDRRVSHRDEWVTVTYEWPCRVSNRDLWMTVNYELPWLMTVFIKISEYMSRCTLTNKYTPVFRMNNVLFYLYIIKGSWLHAKDTHVADCKLLIHPPQHRNLTTQTGLSNLSEFRLLLMACHPPDGLSSSWWLVLSWDVSSLNGFHAHSTATVSFSFLPLFPPFFPFPFSCFFPWMVKTQINDSAQEWRNRTPIVTNFSFAGLLVFFYGTKRPASEISLALLVQIS